MNAPLFKSTTKSKYVKVLFKQSHSIFKSIQEHDTFHPTKISMQYRCIIHELVENSLCDLETKNMFKEIDILWHLCELLVIDIHQTGILISQLKSWIKMHLTNFDNGSKEIINLLNNSCYQLNETDHQTTYWRLVTKLVLLGDTKRASQLLQCHYNYKNSNQIRLVSYMLEAMPSSAQYILHEFHVKWNNWLAECNRELATGQFDDSPELLKIVRLLCQDKDNLDNLITHFDNWYQIMVSYLIYNDPCLKNTDLSELCRKSISMYKNQPNEVSHHSSVDFDKIIIAAFEYDLMKVVALACGYFEDDRWFLAHLIDLLHHGNKLIAHDIVEPEKMRESFILDHAQALFEDDVLWSLGVAYLDYCPNHGIHYLENLLSRVPLTYRDDKQARKLFTIARNRGLKELSKYFNLRMARNWLARKDENFPVNLSSALYWTIKSEDIPLTTHISTLYLKHCCEAGCFPDELVFGNLGRSMLVSERLAFISKYHEFKKIKTDGGDNIEAANLFLSLLSSKIFPEFFTRELLKDANSLLDTNQELALTTEKTFELMKSIKEVNPNYDHHEDRETSRNLVEYMARAIIQPNPL